MAVAYAWNAPVHIALVVPQSTMLPLKTYNICCHSPRSKYLALVQEKRFSLLLHIQPTNFQPWLKHTLVTQRSTSGEKPSTQTTVFPSSLMNLCLEWSKITLKIQKHPLKTTTTFPQQNYSTLATARLHAPSQRFLLVSDISQENSPIRLS